MYANLYTGHIGWRQWQIYNALQLTRQFINEKQKRNSKIYIF